MGLEVPTYINDLVTTNPLATDLKSVGDDHLRAIKSAVRNTFPNANKAFRFPGAQTISSSGSILSTENNQEFFVDTSAGAITMTLPSLAASDSGWSCSFTKISLTSVNPLFLQAAAGAVYSGQYIVAKARRSIPGVRSLCVWNGVIWFITRALAQPVNSLIPYFGIPLPVGYEWPNGQTLPSASTNYVEFYAANGSGVVVDRRGRFYAVNDAMGGTAASRLPNDLLGGITGANSQLIGASGGEPSHILTEAEGDPHDHVANVTEGPHLHAGIPDLTATGLVGSTAGADGRLISSGGVGTKNSSLASTGITVDVVAKGGPANAHNILPPFMVLNELLVVE
jgi:hypothetical protein